MTKRTLLLWSALPVFAIASIGFSRQNAPSSRPDPAVKPNDPLIGQKIKVEGVRNVGIVTPTLLRGGKPTGVGYQNLKNMGVDIVVDLRWFNQGSEKKNVEADGMQFVKIPWECSFPHDSDVSKFLLLLHANPGKKVFVHCIKGDDRTGLEIAAFRMAEQGWTEPQARKEMEAFGFDFLHRRICAGLSYYTSRFPQRFAADPGFQQLRDLLKTSGPLSN